jgi:hypothetical protein
MVKKEKIMKKYLFFALASAALMSVACSEKELKIVDTDVDPISKTAFEAVLDVNPDTKTTLDLSTGAVNWAVGDKIKVFWAGSESVSDPLQASDIDGTKATFHAECSAGPELAIFALYPSSVVVDTYVDGNYAYVTIPAVQDGSFANASISTAKFLEGKFRFQNLCGLLQFSVPAGVDKVVFTSEIPTPLVGKIEFGFPGGNLYENSIKDSLNQITVNVSGTGPHYAAVAPGTHKSLYAALYNGSTLVGEKLAANELVVARRQVKKLGLLPDTKLSNKYFVKPSGAGSKDGSSWDNAADIAAFNSFVTTTAADGKSFYFSAGTYTYTEQLSLAADITFKIFGGYPSDATGEALTNRDIYANETILDGGGTSRLFVVTNGNLTLDGLTFTRAYRTDVDAGTALVFQGAGNQLVNRCKFTNCVHEDLGAGGVMRIAGMSDKTVTITDCVFENNTTAGNGGVLYIEGGTLISKNNIYKNNTATRTADGTYQMGGGAIYIKGAPDCSFEGDMFIGNTAPNATASAILASEGAYTLKLNKCIFSGNSAASRGCVRGMISTGKLYFNACVFHANNIGLHGSAIHTNSPAAIHNCVFYGNTNNSATGASNIYHDKDLLMSNTSIRLGANAACGLRMIAGDNSVIVNNIIYNSLKGSAIIIPASKVLTSYGYNLYKSNTGTTIDGTLTFQDASNHPDSEYDPNVTWVGAPYWVLKWTQWKDGTPPSPSWTLCTPERVEAAIDAFDTATSMGVKTWLNSIGALNTDSRGIARSTTAIWSGSYDNSATSSL